MSGGYMNKVLWVDLETRKTAEENLDPDLVRYFIGGYGTAARIYLDRLEKDVHPLSPENILGFTTGPLTGSPAPSGTRWTVTCKSPLTGGWGDANGSGNFGAKLKHAGYDSVFITGKAEKPVYLLIDSGAIQIKDAQMLWGKDCYEIEDWTKETYGKDAESACIGPAGERLTLISAIIHAKGRAAGRSGVGAVMGSKNLKAVVVRGSQPIPIANPEYTRELRQKYQKQIRSGTGSSGKYTSTGTPGSTVGSMLVGDAPTRNWKESVLHGPDPELFEFSELVKVRDKRKACYRCPIACWGTSKLEYEGELIESHQPEFETEVGFGGNLLNSNLHGIIKANDICNRYGLDTISAAVSIAFAFECYENGLITKLDTGGLELKWGEPKSILAMLEKLAKREDFGDVIADGVMRASKVVGKASEPFAIHAGGQELPMPDPRFEPALAVIYKLDATPGRHTQASDFIVAEGFDSKRPGYGQNRNQQQGRGYWVKEALCLNHTLNVSGACLFGYLSMRIEFIPEFLTAVTGQEFSISDMLLAGERIANVRQVFNVREGINPLKQPDPWRAYGHPALPDGPTGGVSVELDLLVREHLENMGWSLDAAVPTRETLQRLGLSDLLDKIG